MPNYEPRTNGSRGELLRSAERLAEAVTNERERYLILTAVIHELFPAPVTEPTGKEPR